MSLARIDWVQGKAQWHFVGFEQYARVLRDALFRTGVANTIVFAVSAVAVQMILGFALALLTTRIARARVLYRTVFILPILVPGIVIGAIWKLMYNFDFGVLNQLLGVIGVRPIDWLGNGATALAAVIAVDVWHWTPFVFLLMLAGLESLPQDVYEAARVDGATFFQELRYITLPLMLPTIVVTMLFRIIVGVKVFDEIYLLTGGGPGTATEVVSYHDLSPLLHGGPDGLRVGDVGHRPVRAGAGLHRRARCDPAAGCACMKHTKLGALGIHAGLIAAGVIVLFPFVWITLAAFKTQISLMIGEVAFTPTLANFNEVLFSGTSDYIANFRNSLIVATASTLIVLVVATLAAYSIERLRLAALGGARLPAGRGASSTPSRRSRSSARGTSMLPGARPRTTRIRR